MRRVSSSDMRRSGRRTWGQRWGVTMPALSRSCPISNVRWSVRPTDCSLLRHRTWRSRQGTRGRHSTAPPFVPAGESRYRAGAGSAGRAAIRSDSTSRASSKRPSARAHAAKVRAKISRCAWLPPRRWISSRTGRSNSTAVPWSPARAARIAWHRSVATRSISFAVDQKADV